MHAAIIDRDRGPEIAGTRITVYDILDYLKEGCHQWAPFMGLAQFENLFEQARRAGYL